MSNLISQRWVRVMCDWSADGLWDYFGGAADTYDLPVRAETRIRIQNWQRRFETTYDRVDFDAYSFAHQGLSIARTIKFELPDWTVIYFDESLRGHKRREIFEYEIL